MSAKLKAVFLKEAENMEKEERYEWAKTVRCLVDEVEQLQAAQQSVHLTLLESGQNWSSYCSCAACKQRAAVVPQSR